MLPLVIFVLASIALFQLVIFANVYQSNPLFRRKFISKKKRLTMVGQIILKEQTAKFSNATVRRYKQVDAVNAGRYYLSYITVKSEELEFYFQVPNNVYSKLREKHYYEITYYKDLFYEATPTTKPTTKEEDPFETYYKGDTK